MEQPPSEDAFPFGWSPIFLPYNPGHQVTLPTKIFSPTTSRCSHVSLALCPAPLQPGPSLLTPYTAPNQHLMSWVFLVSLIRFCLCLPIWNDCPFEVNPDGFSGQVVSSLPRSVSTEQNPTHVMPCTGTIWYLMLNVTRTCPPLFLSSNDSLLLSALPDNVLLACVIQPPLDQAGRGRVEGSGTNMPSITP